MAVTRGSTAPRILTWSLEALLQTPGRHPRRVEALDQRQDFFHPGRLDAQLCGDLLRRGPQVAVQIQVADDQGADGLACLVQLGHMQLPREVGLQGAFLGIEALEGEGLPLFVFAHGRRHEPVFQESCPSPILPGMTWPRHWRRPLPGPPRRRRRAPGPQAPAPPRAFRQTAIRHLPGPGWFPGPAGFRPPAPAGRAAAA